MQMKRTAASLLALTLGLAAVPADTQAASEPRHAACTSMDLWAGLQEVIDTCEKLIGSGALEGNDLAEAFRHQGDAYFRTFRIDIAFEKYKRALELRPDWPRALNNFGNAAGVLGDPDLAVTSQKRAAEIDPTFSKPHLSLGIALLSRGDVEGALKEYDRALELDPKDYLARFNRALLYNRMERRGDALHDLDSLLAENEEEVNRTWVMERRMPDEDFVGDVLRSQAIVFRNVAAFDDALDALQKALDRKPGYANAAVFRSQLIRGVSGYESLYPEALAAIEQAAALHPHSPEMPELVAEKAALLVRMGKSQEAREVLADAKQFETSGDATFFMERSNVWEQLKEFGLAEADMLTAMQMDRWHFQANIQSMQAAGYLMTWPGLDPDTAMANAITACVHDPLC